VQRKPRLRAEHGIRAGVGAIRLELAVIEHEAKEIVILLHLRRRLNRQWKISASDCIAAKLRFGWFD
jgi:hypothetical protein